MRLCTASIFAIFLAGCGVFGVEGSGNRDDAPRGTAQTETAVGSDVTTSTDPEVEGEPGRKPVTKPAAISTESSAATSTESSVATSTEYSAATSTEYSAATSTESSAATSIATSTVTTEIPAFESDLPPQEVLFDARERCAVMENGRMSCVDTNAFFTYKPNEYGPEISRVISGERVIIRVACATPEAFGIDIGRGRNRVWSPGEVQFVSEGLSAIESWPVRIRQREEPAPGVCRVDVVARIPTLDLEAIEEAVQRGLAALMPGDARLAEAFDAIAAQYETVISLADKIGSMPDDVVKQRATAEAARKAAAKLHGVDWRTESFSEVLELAAPIACAPNAWTRSTARLSIPAITGDHCAFVVKPKVDFAGYAVKAVGISRADGRSAELDLVTRDDGSVAFEAFRLVQDEAITLRIALENAHAKVVAVRQKFPRFDLSSVQVAAPLPTPLRVHDDVNFLYFNDKLAFKLSYALPEGLALRVRPEVSGDNDCAFLDGFDHPETWLSGSGTLELAPAVIFASTTGTCEAQAHFSLGEGLPQYVPVLPIKLHELRTVSLIDQGIERDATSFVAFRWKNERGAPLAGNSRVVFSLMCYDEHATPPDSQTLAAIELPAGVPVDGAIEVEAAQLRELTAGNCATSMHLKSIAIFEGDEDLAVTVKPASETRL
jgi:hypothetical protein